MTEKVTVELPAELARRVRALAAKTQRPFEAVIVEWLDRAVTEPSVDLLPDDQLLAVCDGQLDDSDQDELGNLLARNREGLLVPAERQRLEELMSLYRSGLIRKAHALNLAVARGLRPRLN